MALLRRGYERNMKWNLKKKMKWNKKKHGGAMS